MLRRTPLALVTAGAVLLAAGCADGGGEPTDPTPPAAGGEYPVTVGDVTLTEQPERIVSLSPTVTEMLYAIGAGDQVVAADEYSNHPPEAPTTELSGYEVNVEAVAGYDPDLVVLSAFPDDVVPQFAEIEIPVYVAPDTPATLDEVYVQITELGTLTGHADQAQQVVDGMSEDIAALAAQAPEPDQPLTYYIEIDDNYWTHTADSLYGNLFELVGLSNIAEEAGTVSVQLTAEAIVDANPDFIFLTNTAYGVDAESVASRDGWAAIEAVQSGQIVELDSDIAARWGPRIVDLLEAVVDAVAQAV